MADAPEPKGLSRLLWISGTDDRAETIRIHGLQYIIDNVNADDGLLIVDDVFDTGLSIDALVNTC